jgi:hypothetical protein
LHLSFCGKLLWYIHFAHITICITYHQVFFVMPTTSKVWWTECLTSPMNPKAKTDVQWHIIFKLLKRLCLTSLNFLSQLSFWSKRCKRPPPIFLVYLEITLWSVSFCCVVCVAFRKQTKMSIVWLNRKNCKHCFISLVSAIHLESNIWIWYNDVGICKLWWLNFALKVMIFLLLSTICHLNTYMIKDRDFY